MDGSEKVSFRRIAIMDLGRTGCKAILTLIESGFRHFELVDSRPVTAAEVSSGSILRPRDVGRPRGRAIAARLRGLFPDLELVVRAGPEAGADWHRHWLARCDVCLLTCDFVSEPYVLDVNAAALGEEVALIPGLVLGPVGWLGPLVRAGQGPCLHCAVLRIGVTTGSRAFGLPQTPDPAMCDRVGRKLAEEVERMILGRESLETEGGLIHLALPENDTRHPLLRTTDCPTCGPTGPFMPYRLPTAMDFGERPAAGPGHILELKEKLVSPLTGPIRQACPLQSTDGGPELERWWCEVTDPAGRDLGEPIYAGGTHLLRDAALGAALGEGVERLASIRPNPADIFVASYEEIAGDAVDPSAWDLFHPQTRTRDGFPFCQPQSQQPLSWLWGYSLSQRVPRAIPLSRIFAFPHVVGKEERVDFPIVSGFAAATSPEQAAYHGLLEVLERDAFMIAWANQLPMDRLEIDGSTPHQVGEYFAAFEGSGLEARCVTVKLDLGAHLVVAIGASSRPGEPARFVAAAADFDLNRAARRALSELGASWVVVCDYLKKSGGQMPEPVAGQVTTMSAHGRLYARPDMARYLDVWWHSPRSLPLPGPQMENTHWERLCRGVEAVERAGLEVLVVDLTPPEIKELGLWVMKTLVPGTYPMNFDSRWPHFGGSRITKVPAELELIERPLRFDEFQRVPHPFP
jgi:ribosomal protein S12 methylthiotransferase accessory factor